MSSRDEIVQALVQLEPGAFEDVITAAYRRRLGTEAVGPGVSLGRDATPEQFAHWIGRRHLESDWALERVIYMPTGAPRDEVRLLEVNRLLNPSDPDVVEPLDFTPSTELPYRLFVADVTTDQWERIRQSPESALPAGWKLEAHQTITRG